MILAMDAIHHVVDVASIGVALLGVELSERQITGVWGRKYKSDGGYTHYCAELASTLSMHSNC